MVFKRDLTPLSKKGKVDKHEGKGSTQERLPNRHAMSTLTGGDPGQRSMNNYSKATPTIAEAPSPMLGPAGPNPLG